ncbi:phosphotransferase [Streptomyces sp. JV176]|uniref:phosphotransferase family protein n=1 Tax=Streptomyces sp. JV176 TaxID=858630 RepID=UPI002E774595|nr:phosphotransferase [Streptomyces sp. JV176]MEE1804617.1 phosphotransferase [Streptomyces sp. JV176]
MNAGHADTVPPACGKALRSIHAVPTDFLHTDTGADTDTRTVLVHADFGPHNLPLDPATLQVTAVVDWEFAHPGDPVEDLAWCEWTVRMHHPDHRTSLHHFFDAYDEPVPSWPARGSDSGRSGSGSPRPGRRRRPRGREPVDTGTEPAPTREQPAITSRAG